MKATGKSLEELLVELGNQSGLKGISGLSGDIRDLEEAASAGNERAALALKVYVSAIRQYLAGYIAVLGGIDAVVFTGGIGENSRFIREQVCAGFDWAGLKLDAEKNSSATASEQSIADAGSKIDIWIVPTNEEIVVARQTAAVLNESN